MNLYRLDYLDGCGLAGQVHDLIGPSLDNRQARAKDRGRQAAARTGLDVALTVIDGCTLQLRRTHIIHPDGSIQRSYPT